MLNCVGLNLLFPGLLEVAFPLGLILDELTQLLSWGNLGINHLATVVVWQNDHVAYVKPMTSTKR